MVTMTQRHSDPRVQRLLEKLYGLYEELKSDEHYEMTESVAYGHHDPFDIPTCICDACGEQPTMEMARSEPPRWSVVCRCGRKPPSVRKSQWQAMLEWNGINLASFDYRDLPLFGLSNLDAETGHKRLAGFRRNLELRYNIATLEGYCADDTALFRHRATRERLHTKAAGLFNVVPVGPPVDQAGQAKDQERILIYDRRESQAIRFSIASEHDNAN
jgi:hypothetical protein